MTLDDLKFFRGWFRSYTQAFCWGSEEDRKNISLKIEHTHNVCRFIIRIAEKECNNDCLMLAETVALFHDLGRFSQYARYKTFRDGVSVNHGKLGAEILADEGILGRLPADEQRVIVTAVTFHNAYGLPQLEDKDALLFLKLVRDADKLDIWRLFLELCEGGRKDWMAVAGLGLPDIPVYSAEIVSALLEEKTASVSSMKSLNDFLLLQLSWVYDLNFTASAGIFSEQNCIERFMRHLPQNREMTGISTLLREHVRRRLERDRSWPSCS